MTIKYSTDGDYKLEVSGSDLAGNRATSITYNGEAPRDFTIDKTDPVIEITFDIKTGYKKSLYFNKTRTATVRIKEHNFDHKDAEVDCPGTIKRGEPGKAKVGSWSGSGDQHDLKITFDKDADYVVKAAYTDLAGNEAKSVSSEPFTIDKTKPVIDYDKKKVENGEAYSGKIEPGIIFSDTNYTREGVTFSMESVKGDEGKKLKKGKIIDDADGFGGRGMRHIV